MRKSQYFPFQCWVPNKETTGIIFITSLVLRGPWLEIEPGTSRTRCQHSTTRQSRRQSNKKIVFWKCFATLNIILSFINYNAGSAQKLINNKSITRKKQSIYSCTHVWSILAKHWYDILLMLHIVFELHLLLYNIYCCAIHPGRSIVFWTYNGTVTIDHMTFGSISTEHIKHWINP